MSLLTILMKNNISKEEIDKNMFGTTQRISNNNPLSKNLVIRTLDTTINTEILREEAEKWINLPSHTNISEVIEVSVEEKSLVSLLPSLETLESWLEKRSESAISEEEAIKIVIGILEGILHLQKNGIFYSHLSPQNILLYNETPILTNFGQLKLVFLSKTIDTIVNTIDTKDLYYLPVELLEVLHDNYEDTNPNLLLTYFSNTENFSYIRSITTIFYKLITTTLPYKLSSTSDTQDFLVTIGNIIRIGPNFTELDSLTNISTSTRDIIYKGLCKDPNGRFSNAEEMLEALKKVKIGISDIPISSPNTPISSLYKKLKFYSVPLILFIIIISTICYTVITYTSIPDKDEKTASTTNPQKSPSPAPPTPSIKPVPTDNDHKPELPKPDDNDSDKSKDEKPSKDSLSKQLIQQPPISVPTTTIDPKPELPKQPIQQPPISAPTTTIDPPPQEQPATYCMRGNYHYNQGKLDQALADFNLAIQLDPKYAAAYYNRGNVYSKQGKLDQALADFNKAIELDPKDATNYLHRASFYYTQGKLDLVLADYTKAIQLDHPRKTDTYFNRGIVYAKQGKLDLALADFNKVIELDPKNATNYLHRASFYYTQDKLDLALADYNKAIELDPKYAAAYNNRAHLYAKQGKLDLVLADYTKAIQLDPKNTHAYYFRASVYKDQSKFDQALADYTKAIELDPEDAYTYNNRGDVYKNQGKFDKALDDYNLALKLDPEYADAYYNRGLVHKRLNNKAQAIADFQKVKSLYKDPRNIARCVEQLRELGVTE
jgi:tetratricopeptide (TPR) repeat protein/serine/threonine protein kinase